MCRYLVTAVQLLAPKVDAGGDPAAGFDWCCQVVEAAGFPQAAAELAQARPAALLQYGQHAAAVKALKVPIRHRAMMLLIAVCCASCSGGQLGSVSRMGIICQLLSAKPHKPVRVKFGRCGNMCS